MIRSIPRTYIVLLALSVVCCQNSMGVNTVDQDDYARISRGMEYREVTAALGKPAACSSQLVPMKVMGFTKDLETEDCIWGSQPRRIQVKFLAGIVVDMTCEGLSLEVPPMFVELTYDVFKAEFDEIFLSDLEEEIALGEAADIQIRKTYEMADMSAYGHVRALGMRIADAGQRSELEYQFFVLEEDFVNAFAVPGGKIYITTEALTVLESEPAIAAVLAHEVAHIERKHGLKRIKSKVAAEIGFNELRKIVLESDQTLIRKAFLKAVEISGGFVGLKYSRVNEHEADVLGTQLLSAAGFEPEAMLRTLDTLLDSDQSEFLTIFSTHPHPKQRIEKIEEALYGSSPRPGG